MLISVTIVISIEVTASKFKMPFFILLFFISVCLIAPSVRFAQLNVIVLHFRKILFNYSFQYSAPDLTRTAIPTQPIQNTPLAYPHDHHFYFVDQNQCNEIYNRVYSVNQNLRIFIDNITQRGRLSITVPGGWDIRFRVFLVWTEQMEFNLRDLMWLAYVNDDVISFVKNVECEKLKSSHPLSVTMSNLLTKLKGMQVRIDADTLLMTAKQMNFYNELLKNNATKFQKLPKTDLEQVAACFDKGGKDLKPLTVTSACLKGLHRSNVEEEFQQFCKYIRSKDPNEVRKVFDTYNEFLIKKLQDFNKPEIMNQIQNIFEKFNQLMEESTGIVKRTFDEVNEIVRRTKMT